MIEFKDIVSDEFSKKMPLRFYPRKLRIKVEKEFVTPARAVIDSEYKNKMNFPNQIKFDDYVSISVQYFTEQKLQSFLNENGAMKKLSDNVSQFSKSATDSYLSVLSLRPQKSAWPELNEKQFGRFIRFLNIVQGGLNTRSLPNISVNFDYKTAVKEFCTQYQEFNPIVWLDLREDDPHIFQKKIDLLKNMVKNKQLQIIGFYAGKTDTFDQYNVNLDYVYTEFKDEEVLLLYEGSYKAFSNQYIGVSKLHYHPFEVFDVISPYKFIRGGNGKEGETYLEKAKNTSFLDTDDVSLKKFQNMDKTKIDMYLKHIDKKSRGTMDEIVDKIEHSQELEEIEYRKFASFANTQQVVAGENEIKELSKRIENGDTLDYLEEKKDLKNEVVNRLSLKNSHYTLDEYK